MRPDRGRNADNRRFVRGCTLRGGGKPQNINALTRTTHDGGVARGDCEVRRNLVCKDGKASFRDPLHLSENGHNGTFERYGCARKDLTMHDQKHWHCRNRLGIDVSRNATRGGGLWHGTRSKEQETGATE